MLETNKAVAFKRKAYVDRKHNVKPSVQKALDRGDIQGVIDNLKPMQRRFCEFYCHHFNASKAVQQAGYTTKYPNKVAHQMLIHPGIRAAVDGILHERKDVVDVDVNYVLKKIVRALEAAESKEQFQTVLRATELLGKHLGMFVEKHEVTGKDGEAIRYEEVNNEATDFARAIARLAAREGTDGLPLNALN